MNNDITLEEVVNGQQVFFFTKPSDKMPACITRVEYTDTDERDRPFASLSGIGWVPLYHVKLIPKSMLDNPSLNPGAGLPGPHILEPLKGIDY